MDRFAAFLRGINVGGNKTIKMEELKETFEKLSFKNVKTVLNSGNVLFDSAEKDQSKLEIKIEKAILKYFGLTSSVVVRPMAYLKEIFEAEPFKLIKVTPQTRLYISFLKDDVKSKLKIPYASADKSIRILRVKDKSIFSVLALTPDCGSVDLMSMLEKEFGKNITTRNWNTVERLVSK